jgi:hypothetical protein
VADFSLRPELVVAELGMQRVDGPTRKLVAEERDHRQEGVGFDERTARNGMDVSPVDDRPDERVLGSEQCDVAE